MPLQTNYRSTEKATMVHLHSGEVFDLPYMPSEIKRQIKVNWSKHQIPGLSHRRSQFINTDNQAFSFDVVVDGLSPVVGGSKGVDKAMRFLESLCYPRASDRIDGAGPSDVLFIVPNSIRVILKIDSVEISEDIRYRDGSVRRFTASIKCHEQFEKRMTYKDIKNRYQKSERDYERAGTGLTGTVQLLSVKIRR